MLPTNLPVIRPSITFELVGLDVVEFEVVRDRVDDVTEPARHHTAVVAEAAQRADGGAGAGGEHDLRGNLVEHGFVESGKGGDALPQRILEVDLAPHRRLRDRADLVLDTGAGGEHLDHLALDEGRVDVEHDEPLGAPGESGALDRDVDAGPDCDLREPGTQQRVGVGAGVGRR